MLTLPGAIRERIAKLAGNLVLFAPKPSGFIDCKTGETCLIQRRYLKRTKINHYGIKAMPFRKGK